MRTFKFTAFLVLAFVISTVVGAKADETAKSNPYFGVLSATSSAELPGKAADLVSQADAKQIQQTTIDVVKAAIALNPAAARAIVGTIAHSSPEMAAVAAGTAVRLLPSQDVTIATVAAAAAPSQAGKIVEAICLVVPNDYEKVGDAVAEIVPGASKEILAGVATAVPSLKGLIDQVLAVSNGSTPSVNDVLAQVAQGQGKVVAAGLISGPQADLSGHGTPITPYQAPPGSVTDITPSSGGEVPSGGRYESP
jgi:hypothetical protein